MTATAITVPTTYSTKARPTVRPVWKTGLAAGLTASVATTATAAVAHAGGV